MDLKLVPAFWAVSLDLELVPADFYWRMTLEPALLMSPCDGMTRWPLCWIWGCVLLVKSFATGSTLVLDLELMPDVTGHLFLMV